MHSEECLKINAGNPHSVNAKYIMIVAGEASGDLHGGNLVREMNRIDPNIKFFGVGGKNMKEAGVDLVANSADMAVVGLTEVFSRLGTIRGVMRRLKTLLKTVSPDLLILIDYPDFNLSLAKIAKKNGVKIFYYISPQVWAWRKGRIETIKKNIDKMAVILPFEAQLYHEAGVEAFFVGHPLLDLVKLKYSRTEAFKLFDIHEGVTTVGILPGSRESEVVKLLPSMLKAAEIIKEELSPVQFILPLADTLDINFITDIINKYPVPVKIIRNEIYDVIACADVVMVASGTATLETALLEKPMVIIYKISPLSYTIGKMIIHIDHIGLVNVIAGKTLVPELIQNKATPENIAAEIIHLLTNEEEMHRTRSALSQIRNMLGAPGASSRAAGLAYGML